MPDDHSKLEPLLPIPNRTVKRLRADDSADPRVKVGHRQALIPKTPVHKYSTYSDRGFAFGGSKSLPVLSQIRGAHKCRVGEGLGA